MENIIGDLGVICLILFPFFLILGVGGFLFEKALDRFPRFRCFLERICDVDLSEEWDDD